MAQERKTRHSKRLEKQQTPVSIVPPKRAHLAQKSLFDHRGKPTEIEVVLPPIPLPSIDDILYCGPEPDFEAVYFSLYDKLAWYCYSAEKTGYVETAAIKEKARAVLQGIKNTTQLTNHKPIINLFNHLAELISDHLISPAQLNLTHTKAFLSKITNDQANMLDDDLVLPLISGFEALELNDKPPLDESFSVPSIEEILQWNTTHSTDNTDNREDINFLPDEFPAELFPDAPKCILVNSSFAKIMSVINETKTEPLKRPESPSSDETISPTPSHYELTRVHELGLRKKARVDYCEDETPEMRRCKK